MIYEQDEQDDDDDDAHCVYGVYDGDLLDDSVQTIVERSEMGREQQFEQKNVFREVDIDFVSRVDLYTHFGECIYSVRSPAYKIAEQELEIMKQKVLKKKKKSEQQQQQQQEETTTAPPPPPPPFHHCLLILVPPALLLPIYWEVQDEKYWLLWMTIFVHHDYRITCPMSHLIAHFLHDKNQAQ